MIYVQKKGSKAWHWAANCTNLPHKIARMVNLAEGRPPSGELDNQCRAKEENGVLIPIDEALALSLMATHE